MATLVLTHADVVRHLSALYLLEDLKAAFIEDSKQRSIEPQRARAPLGEPNTAMVLFPGVLPGIPAYTVKVHAKFPGSTPAIRGLVHLHDASTGELLAVMDSTHLTALRTGVMGALAADVLARPDATTVAVIGAGRQGALHLKSLRMVRSLRRVFIYDTDFVRAHQLATRIYQELSLPCTPVTSVEDATAEAELIVTATFAKEPFLLPSMVRPGTHITALGSDEADKRELSSGLVVKSRLVVDHRGLALESGVLAGAGLAEASVQAELGEILAGTKPGRTSPDEITLFAPVGLPFLDLVAAWQVYQSAREDEAIRQIDFLG